MRNRRRPVVLARSDSLSRPSKNAWPQSLGAIVAILILVGYPITAMASTLLQTPSELLTTPFRALVLAISILSILGAARYRAGRMDWVFGVFLLLYGVRLVYDAIFKQMMGAEEALLFFVVAVAIPVCAVCVSGAAYFEEKRAAIWLMFGAGLVAVLALISERLGLRFEPYADVYVQNPRLSFEALNAISLGNSGALALLSSAFLLTSQRHWNFIRASTVLIGLLGILILLLANSRGPIISTGLALLWFFSIRKQIVPIAASLCLAFLLLLPFVDFASSELLSNIADRFTQGLSEGASNIARTTALEEGWNSFLNAPILGESFAIAREQGPAYPHNIFIETAMALGLLGLILLFVIFNRLWARITTGFNAAHPLLVMLLVQKFVGANFSGSIWGSDALFLLVGVALVAPFASKSRKHLPNLRGSR